ncbi:hypothetical protein EV652_11250 [Kribbella steppae]|uniref:Uncharacterized protein n=1 Tax=Kribbella steppae TaxID=2512223 RepID=A0A4R2H3X9_9ACTN|nr:hypothetical protein [Kribbella steppae]TCO20304.1 hypothetical protein EV652_11250 [Kribbella steppae]
MTTERTTASNSTHVGGPPSGVRRTAVTLWSTVALALGIVMASAYGLLAAEPYRDLPAATVLGAQAQDVCSILVAGVLVFLVRRPQVSPRGHLARLGLLAYVVYSYAIYLTGVPMNRVFLVYVVIESLAGAALLNGLLRLRGSAWQRPGSRRLERGTGWMLLVVAVLFALLWLSTLVPYAAGGPVPDPEGVGGTPYPVFVLDLVVVLPCIAAVGVMLLRGRPVGGPLAVVALIKIVTLFTALWAGVAAVLVTGETLHLGPDAGPSAALLVASVWLTVRWLRALRADEHTFLRPSLWDDASPSDHPTRGVQ